MIRALTVRQPWAWAIIHGGKDVENRSRNIARGHRGPVAIHAGISMDVGGVTDDRILAAIEAYYQKHGRGEAGGLVPTGAIIGVVDLVDVHHAHDCWRSMTHQGTGEVEEGHCSPWAEPDVYHLMFANPRPLAVPIPWRGMLGLWPVPADLEAMIDSQEVKR